MNENDEKMNILIFIPARNESAAIGKVIDSSISAMRSAGHDLSVLVIDDGSDDDTSEIARAHHALVIRHDVNRGLGTVFQEAVRYAIEHNVDVLITIDGDGQFSPDDIPRLFAPILKKKADFVSGSRFMRESDLHGIPLAKKGGNWLVARIVSSIIGKRYRDVSCGFRAYNREALLRLNLFGGFTYTQEVFLVLGTKNLRIAEVPITVHYFPSRTSRIANSLFKYGWQVIRIIIKAALYYRPMRFFGIIAALFFSFGFIALFLLGLRFYYTGLITPYKTIGVLAVAALGCGFVSFLAGIFLQIVSRIQMTVDDVLYYARKR